jgi:hypothetical protein
MGVVFVRNLTDFSVYYAAGRSLLNGRTDLYAPDFARGVVMDYRYLPFVILAFAPLSFAPYPVAAWAWHLLNTAAIARSRRLRRCTPGCPTTAQRSGRSRSWSSFRISRWHSITATCN